MRISRRGNVTLYDDPDADAVGRYDNKRGFVSCGQRVVQRGARRGQRSYFEKNEFGIRFFIQKRGKPPDLQIFNKTFTNLLPIFSVF